MKQLVINIKDNKLPFFLELIKNFDFISIEDNSGDWYNQLSEKEKKSIQKGIDDLDNGRIIAHDEVMASVKAKLNELKNR